MSATPMTINFSNILDVRQHTTGRPMDGSKVAKPRDERGRLLTPRQIRARARRKVARTEVMTKQELEHLYQKPLEEWDLDELAHGRPKNNKGHFSGPHPKWISTAMHEEAMTRYTAAVKTSMRATTVDALDVIKSLINDDNIDEKGRPFIPASVKLEAAKFLLEHVVGKPTQRIESDVSVKLQGILGQVMVNPAEIFESNGVKQQSYALGHLPGITSPMSDGSDNRDDDDDDLLPTD